MAMDEWTAKLTNAARTGRPLDLAGARADLSDADHWGSERKVPAEAIRATLLNPGLDPDPYGLTVRGADVTGVLELGFSRLPCRLALQHCRFVEPVIMQQIVVPALSFSGSRLNGLDLDNAQIDGDVHLDDGFTADGTVRALRAQIGGQLNLSRGTVRSLGGAAALALDGAVIAGGLFLVGFTASGEVRALGAQIGRQLNARGAGLRNADGDALSLDGAHIGGDMLLDDHFTAIGEVRAPSAHIAGNLTMTGANLSKPNGRALNLQTVRIDNNVALDLVTANGEVTAANAQIGGQFNAREASLTREGGQALVLDGSLIKGGTFLDDRFTAIGEVRAVHSHLTGPLELSGATIHNPEGDALSLDFAHITGRLVLGDDFIASGTVDLSGATLDGGLRIRGATYGGLALDAATIGLLWTDRAPSRLLSAASMKVSDIRGSLNGPRIAIAWLDTMTHGEFAVQPWHEVAAVYERQGRPADAKRLRFQAARRVTRHAPWWSKPVRWLYGAFAGYGYYPLLAGLWLLLAAFVAGLMTSQFGPAIAGFDPWLYGAAVVIPPAAAITPSSWTVTDPLWLAWVNIGLKGFGWLQTGILLAGLTGLLKKS